MGIKAAIRTTLLTNSNLTALIGDRIAPQFSATTSELPRLEYERVNADVAEDMQTLVGPWRETFNFYIHAKSTDQAESIREEIIAVLSSFTRSTVEGVVIDRFFFNASSETYSIPTDKEQRIYENLISYEVVYHAT